MKNLILLTAIMMIDSIQALELDITITNSDELLFDYVNEIMTIKADTGPIQHFNGPAGCTSNCIVNPTTPFNLDWGVKDVQSCAGSNTTNHPSFNGNVDPIGGGTGEFSKTIIGGLVANTVFTLTCQEVALKNYALLFMKKEITSITVPPNVYLMTKILNGTTYFLNIIENKKLDAIANKPVAFKQVGNDQWYSEIYVSKKEELNNRQTTIQFEHVKKAKDFDKIWLIVTEKDPRTEDFTHPYDIGECDILAKEPTLNISTNATLQTNLSDECILKPNKEYFIIKAYFKEKPLHN